MKTLSLWAKDVTLPAARYISHPSRLGQVLLQSDRMRRLDKGELIAFGLFLVYCRGPVVRRRSLFFVRAAECREKNVAGRGWG